MLVCLHTHTDLILNCENCIPNLIQLYFCTRRYKSIETYLYIKPYWVRLLSCSFFLCLILFSVFVCSSNKYEYLEKKPLFVCMCVYCRLFVYFISTIYSFEIDTRQPAMLLIPRKKDRNICALTK